MEFRREPAIDMRSTWRQDAHEKCLLDIFRG
jgi:hypothetical protein